MEGRGLEMLSKRIFRWLIPVLIVGSSVLAMLLYPSVYARYLLYELKELQLNHSTFEDAQKFAKRIGAQERSFVSCTPADCEWYKAIDNAKLPQWYRGKGVTFMVLFTVKQSMVTQKAVEYSVGVGDLPLDQTLIGRPRVDVFESDGWFSQERESRLRRLHRLPRGEQEKLPAIEGQTFHKGWEKIWYDEKSGKMISDAFAVSIAPESKSILEDWKKYTAFNYSCFWKYKGCNYGKDLLPIADPYPPASSSY